MENYLHWVEGQTRCMAQQMSHYRARVSTPGVPRSELLVQVQAGLCSKTHDTVQDIEILYQEMRILKTYLEQVRTGMILYRVYRSNNTCLCLAGGKEEDEAWREQPPAQCYHCSHLHCGVSCVYKQDYLVLNFIATT